MGERISERLVKNMGHACVSILPMTRKGGQDARHLPLRAPAIRQGLRFHFVNGAPDHFPRMDPVGVKSTVSELRARHFSRLRAH